ncbi:glycosyl hydrolase [Sphingomonas cannabina]|uniref:glycoside hydrolase family 30 protein n=1 Tax=Sphingomonas cannabina TaxID=2899123 RepID=UPI001F354A46|nr:glycoside hydrolase [Sphingomonas cannabina]UIJ47108.1 glycosyl hydrolase [Sphingomonas cannabina]
MWRTRAAAGMIPLALLAALMLPLPAAAQQPPPTAEAEVVITIRPAVERPGTEFEGWGTALAWFAHVTGGWPEADRARLADLFYGPDGLGWTIARYNIGGGNAAATPPYLRVGAAVPGFWRQSASGSGKDWWRPDHPAMWDWSQDANQRWWLDAVRERVKAPIFEAFSNSPPWFMTVSGRVSGAEKATDDNLRPGQERAFAAYLARVVDELQRRHGIAFRTLSPFNEPNTDYWYAANTQEGTHWSPERQAKMIDAADAALKARRLATRIAAPDETNSHLFVEDWAAYPPATRARIGQLNVHSYGSVHQTAVRDIARTSGIRLWMSENDTPLPKDPEDFDGIASALALAEHIVEDLKRLEPGAWVFWQAVETLSARDGKPGSNWGLVKADLGAPATGSHMLYVTRKYWAMAQFSRYIRPGYRLVAIDDPDTAGALSPDGRTLVLIHVNGGLSPRRLDAALSGNWSAETIVTDASRRAERIAAGEALRAPPRSIATFLLRRR